MPDDGKVNSSIKDGVASLTFSHPKGNSLPGVLLRAMAAEIDRLGVDPQARVIVLRSEGEKTFCGGASFAELTAANTAEKGTTFFMGFANLILAMRRCPKFVIARVQGRAVGGGVGVISAADFVLATANSSIKLSELAIGIGPFVIGPAVQRRVGTGPFSQMSIDADWRDASWAATHGLYGQVYQSIAELDGAVDKLAKRLAGFSPEATSRLKAVLWEDTDHWDELLPKRAAISGELVRSDFAQKAIASAEK